MVTISDQLLAQALQTASYGALCGAVLCAVALVAALLRHGLPGIESAVQTRDQRYGPLLRSSRTSDGWFTGWVSGAWALMLFLLATGWSPMDHHLRRLPRR